MVSAVGAAGARVSEGELAVRAQRGDREAEGLLCSRLAPAVAAFARRRLATRDAVREFQQDAMLLFVEALRRGAVEDPARVAGFVLGICRNLALDRVRQRERRAALWETFGAAVTAVVPALPERPTFEIMRLEDCLTGLTQRARDAVWLSYGELKSHAEVAAALGISEGNARVLRHRALATLRECLSVPKGWESAR
jgi:RNA polymerase sigma-70 factor (ECF subfamily)